MNDDSLDILNKNYIVAFVDTLGSKERFKNGDQISIFKLFKQALEEAQDGIYRIKGLEELCIDIKIRTFTDNMFFYLKLDGDTEEKKKQVLRFIKYLNFVQVVFLENNWLLRGFVTFGDLFFNEDIIFGNALIEAYQNESSEVSTPRIVLDGDYSFWDKLTTDKNGYSSFDALKDIDGKTFLNYIPFAISNHEKVKSNIEKLFLEANDIKALQKILMLIANWNRIFDELHDEKYIINITNLFSEKIKM